MKSLPLGLLILLGAFSIGAQAQTSIAILNPGFENPTLSTYQEGATAIPDWTEGTSSAGEQNGASAGYGPGSGIQGSNFAFDDTTSIISQTLTSTFQAGTYTLSFDLGQRSGVANAGGSFSLYDQSGTLLKTSGIVDATTGVGSGQFTDFSITYTVAPGSSVIGQKIVIEFAGGNQKINSPHTDNADFDDASLLLTVPEPSTYAFLLVGAVVLLGVTRIRRRALAVC